MLFVSCQPFKDESYYTKEFVLNMAFAAKLGGAKGLRIEGIEIISFVKDNIDFPIIGLIKNRIEGKERYITPDLNEINDIINLNCEYIAIDYTIRDNCNQDYYMNLTEHIHEKSGCKIVADISNIEEAKLASRCGADFIATTLRGYTNDTQGKELPDIDFVKQLKDEGIENIIAEGGYSTHSEYIKALENGAKIVTIGTAISRPHLIVKKIIQGHY